MYWHQNNLFWRPQINPFWPKLWSYSSTPGWTIEQWKTEVHSNHQRGLLALYYKKKLGAQIGFSIENRDIDISHTVSERNFHHVTSMILRFSCRRKKINCIQNVRMLRQTTSTVYFHSAPNSPACCNFNFPRIAQMCSQNHWKKEEIELGMWLPGIPNLFFQLPEYQLWPQICIPYTPELIMALPTVSFFSIDFSHMIESNKLSAWYVFTVETYRSTRMIWLIL